MPIGFKNATNGGVKIAIDAIMSAKYDHTFPGTTKHGHVAIIKTKGNNYCHLILRGGQDRPNYYQEDINDITQQLSNNNLVPNIIVDFSHDKFPKKIYKSAIGIRMCFITNKIWK